MTAAGRRSECRDGHGTRYAMLINPHSGRGGAGKKAQRAAGRLREAGAEVTELVGEDAADALRLARTAVAEQEQPDALIAVGGDGLIGIALQALAGTGVPLGIIPAGTGNDHARAYAIPMGDPEAAADVVLAGRARRVDLGRVRAAGGSEAVFGTVLATGFDSLVTDRTNRMSWPHGRMRYNLAILAEFARLRPLPFRLVLDQGTTEQRTAEHDVVLAAVGVTRSYGGGMLICPGADPSDGLLDITVIDYVPRRTLIRLFPTVFRGTHVRRPQVRTLRARTVDIACPGITAYADGEPVGPLPVTVDVLPGALAILVL